MKKIFVTLLILTLTLSSSGLAFANENKEQVEPFIDSKDTVVYVDGGAYDILMSISDLDKRQKIAEYWLTPAYTEYSVTTEGNVRVSGEPSGALKEESDYLDELKMLVGIPSEELDAQISHLTAEASNEILNKSNVIVSDGFIKKVELISTEFAAEKE